MLSTIVRRIPAEAAKAITEGVMEKVNDVFQKPIMDKVVDFLANDLQLSDGDFFLLLASIQPNYQQIMAPPPPSSGEQKDDEESKEEEKEEEKEKPTSGGAITTPPSSGAASISQQIWNVLARTGGEFTKETREQINKSLDPIPKHLEELFTGNNGEDGKKLLREATIDGFRALLKQLAKEEDPKKAFLAALVKRIETIVADEKVIKTENFTKLITGAGLSHTSVANFAEIAMDNFDALRRSANDAADAATGIAAGDDAKVAKAAIQRQDDLLDRTYADLTRAHELIGAFLAAKDNKRPSSSSSEQKKPDEAVKQPPPAPPGGGGAGRRRARSMRRVFPKRKRRVVVASRRRGVI